MLIKMLQEITVWDTPIYNGIYHMNGAGQCVAYQNSTGLKTFNTPMKGFSKSKRKFKQIGEYDA